MKIKAIAQHALKVTMLGLRSIPSWRLPALRRVKHWIFRTQDSLYLASSQIQSRRGKNWTRFRGNRLCKHWRLTKIVNGFDGFFEGPRSTNWVLCLSSEYPFDDSVLSKVFKDLMNGQDSASHTCLTERPCQQISVGSALPADERFLLQPNTVVHQYLVIIKHCYYF